MHLNLVKITQDYKSSRHESERIISRMLALIELARLRSDAPVFKDWMYRKIASQFKISERTLYRWASAYSRLGLYGITPKLASGRKRKYITGWLAKHIKNMRDDYNWGAEVIWAHLKHDHGINISKYKIHRFLSDRKYIHRKVRKIKDKKHFRTVVVEVPGQHTQLDVKHLPHLLKNGKKSYVYNFVDHATKWSFKLAYEGCGVWETYRFMEALLDVCPFEIKRLQTDHGIEFTYKFMPHLQDSTVHPLEHFCSINKIIKKLIPVGEKEVNGLVERSHRQDDNELYETIRPVNINHFNQLLMRHTKWLNQSRRRKPLKWKTANEALLDFKKQTSVVSIKEESEINTAA